MIKVGIIGGTGYVGAELMRLLMSHKEVEIAAISSVSFKGQDFASIYPSFYQLSDLVCGEEDEVIEKSDVIFAALPHGLSEHIAKKVLEKGKICIDLGADFRLSQEEVYTKWYAKSFDVPELHGKEVYGLPELNREKIKETKLVANPGCYATSIELALLPLISKGIIEEKGIIADSKSGTTGAGRNLSQTTHFTDVNESFSAYKIAGHRHIPEIEEVLSSVSDEKVKLIFTPHLLPINRGILSTIYATPKNKIDLKELHKEYSAFYENEPFVKVLPLGEAAKINNVRLSNYCHISLHYDEENNKLVLISCIDNMVKGAAGQAIQNMNIILGFAETEGLASVAPIF
ncbi:MAG: N-acetyl-gamma-glutamyl-phosphate reductase [Clostridiaceae bacterium]